MSVLATVDEDNRLRIPDEAREWFPAGSQFVVERQGDVVTLRPVNGLAAHLIAVEGAGGEALTSEEIQAEVEAHRREHRVLGR